MKDQEFKFIRLSKPFSQTEVLEYYNIIFKKYLEKVFNIKDDIKLVIEDLKYRNNKLINSTGLLEITHIENAIGYIMPYNCSLKITLVFIEDNSIIFTFLIYNQNNCCGAMTLSNTFIPNKYRDKGFGTLLQYFKEDLALQQGVSLLTCTDVFYEKYYNSLEKLKELKPYLANTKVLLNTGWKVSKLFHNKKSNNVVGLFTKDLIKLKEDKTISMKIKEDNKLVKIENITIGTDPELFLRSIDTKEFIPSFKYIKGDKYNPVIISDEGHGLSCDNVMVEYTIPPSKTADDYIKHNLFVQEYLREKVCKQHNLELVITPFAEFSDNELKDDRASIFG